ncbi:MAG TPA: pyridoxal-phosphate dependent enzyme, partial [Anaerolineaceae bacterium]
MDALICRSCQKSYSLDEPRWRCSCGGLLDIRFTPRLDIKALSARKPDLWRYREAIPLPADAPVISLGEGFTPLLPLEVDGRPVWIKQDYLFPTGSYKDRGAAVLISKAAQLGVRTVVEDSSGNAGSAVAAYCARAGIGCTIYVPEHTSAAKLAQILWYGARLVRVPGSREDTAWAVMSAAETTFYASHSWNPFFF